MKNELLKIRGARHHNLAGINVDLPKNRIVVITGLSGSGKSTLAFDTIYAEGQRRYVESLSAYARQFLDMMDKPDLDSIEGLSPAISIQQKTINKNPRSTVGTITEIYDYMRLLYSRVGQMYCPKCGRKISSQSADAICLSILREYTSKEITILAPVIKHKKGTHEKIFEKMRQDGYAKVRINGSITNLNSKLDPLNRQKWHNIEIVIDVIQVKNTEKPRLFEGIQAALSASNGYVTILSGSDEDVFSQENACPHCNITIGEMEPRTFSFNSPFGMCPTCNGLGIMMEFDPDLVIPDRTKSILRGAIAPWNGRYESFHKNALPAVAKEFGFNLMTPISKMTEEQINIILYGSDEVIEPDESDFDWIFEPAYIFNGVINVLQRAFLSTESESKRSWLLQFMHDTPCKECNGKKLKPETLAVRIGDMGIMDVCDMSITTCGDFFNQIKLSETEQHIAKDILKEIRARLDFLLNVGLGYLTLNRSSSTLSGGESQRIRLATQIGSNLTGVLYVLDEPTIGLHQRDNDRLIVTLERLRDLGNTVIVVEHDEEVIRSADWLLDLGPGAGVHGGNIVFEGKPSQITLSEKSITGNYLSGRSKISIDKRIRKKYGWLEVKTAAENNLKNIDVKFPLGLFTVVTGVSGSGKSTLVNQILLRAMTSKINGSQKKPGKHTKINGANGIDKVVAIDQSPIGRTPRSNPATYIGIFTPIRDLFASTDAARQRGYRAGRFSFNVSSGRCFACEGDGVRQIEMQFLADVYVTCDECRGKRYNSETLAITYKGKTISDVLEMTVEEALEFFKNILVIRRKLQTIYDVGLGYIKLGQSSTTLSGGEAQRVKLAAELSKRDTGRTLYVLDEPTTGLHFADVQKLLDVLNRLANQGNTIIVIEHNLDVIGCADWIIDLGPEGGDEGGEVVACGTPLSIAKSDGHTGRYLGRMRHGTKKRHI
ncbi:MAG: Excinuclease ABC subunit A [Cenarchaeum symbiont of Oopsacas minuta]|nr:Excinuclease ABC subunit A [Cenarchaeum symbiont of Oopsacas minuta]